MIEYVLGAVVLYLIFSPPKWDPAILWKEMQMRTNYTSTESLK